MALDETALALIDRTLAACVANEGLRSAAAQLRGQLPGMVVLLCDAADVLEDPWRSYPVIDLHFVDTRNHCTEMTCDPATATGLLLAGRSAGA
jgi:hypothetical protein